MPDSSTSRLLSSAKAGNLKAVRAILASSVCSIEATNEAGATSLLLAAANGHTAIVRL